MNTASPERSTAAPNANDFMLLDMFLSAYEAIRDIRDGLEQGDDSLGEGDQDHRLDALSQQLKTKIEHATQVSDQSEHLQAAVARLRYALVALVDEQLVYNVHSLRDQVWTQYLVEEQFYGTSLAGRDLLVAMDTLADEVWSEVLISQVALIYMMVLQLGFRGELREEDDRIRQKYAALKELIVGEEHSADIPTQAFAQAYAHNIEVETPERLAPLSRWTKYMLLLTGLYLASAYGVWVVLLQDFKGLGGA